jgi:hypothetical protein
MFNFDWFAGNETNPLRSCGLGTVAYVWAASRRLRLRSVVGVLAKRRERLIILLVALCRGQFATDGAVSYLFIRPTAARVSGKVTAIGGQMPRAGGSNSGVIDEPAAHDWPADLELIISALQAGENLIADPASNPLAHGRYQSRMDYRVRATLRLFSDNPGTGPWRLFTRDANSRGLGFLTPHRLPLGYGGTVDVIAPNRERLVIPCTLLRCREVASGWFDGALYFNRDQPLFCAR